MNILATFLIALITSVGTFFIAPKSHLFGASILTTVTTDTLDTFRTNVNTSLTNINTALSGFGSGTISTSTNAVVSNLLYFSGASTVANVATSSETCSSGISCTAHTVLTGGGAITLSTVAANSVLGTYATGVPSAIATSSLYTFPWTVGNGGTGLSTVGDGKILFGAGGTAALTALATSTSGNVLQLDFATGRPSWVATSSLNISGSGVAASNPTYQILTAAATSTYTTPANVTSLHIRMCAAGAGGGSNSGDGPSATSTEFGRLGVGTTTAQGGSGVGNNQGSYIGGLGGSGGTTNIGTLLFRSKGGDGGTGGAVTGTTLPGGTGGASAFGGGGAGGSSVSGRDATGTYCAGGGGQGNGAASSGGGGAGEYVEFTIANPAASYVYAVSQGQVPTAGGGKGANGIIIVEEYYH